MKIGIGCQLEPIVSALGKTIKAFSLDSSDQSPVQRLFHSQKSYASSLNENHSKNWNVPSSGRGLKAMRAIPGYYSAMYLKENKKESFQVISSLGICNFYLIKQNKTKKNHSMGHLERSSPQSGHPSPMPTHLVFFLACSSLSSPLPRPTKHLKNPSKMSNSLENLFWRFQRVRFDRNRRHS